MALGNFSNLAEGTLASAINASDTTANLTAGQGAYFPASSFYVVLWDKSYTDPATAYRAAKAEVVLCTSRTTDALTITRAQQGSSAVDFTGLTVGVIHGFTKTDIDEIVALIALKAPLVSPTFTGTVTTPAANLSGLTASRAVATDGSKNLASSAVTGTELGYVSGVTSAIQTQLDAKSPSASDTAYAGSWNGVTTIPPSKNAVYDEMELRAPKASPTFSGTISALSNNTVDFGANSTRFKNAYFSGNVNIHYQLQLEPTVGGALVFSSQVGITSPADGILLLTDSTGTSMGGFKFGGTGTSHPYLKRSGATLQARLANDSDFAAIQTLYQRFGSGSPESVVTAPAGAIYHNTAGGAGVSLYVKESGSGNTGWIAK